MPETPFDLNSAVEVPNQSQEFDMQSAVDITDQQPEFDLQSAVAIDEPQKTVYIQDRNKVVSFPDTYSDYEMNYALKTEIDKKPKNNFFGMLELGENSLKGIGNFLASTPQTAGSLLKESGEVGVQERTQADATANLSNKFILTPDELVGYVSRRISEGLKIPERLRDSGQKLIDMNKSFVDKLGLKPTEGKANKIAFDIGSGLGSVGSSIGLTVLTKKPELIAPLFGFIQKGQIYEEARNAGKDPQNASTISSTSGIAEGALEFVGLHVFFDGIKASGKFAKIALRSAAEGVQEGTQQTAEETITGLSGVRKDKAEDIIKRIGYATALGAISSAPVSAIFTIAERQGVVDDLKAEGKTDEEAKAIIEKISENQSNNGLLDEVSKIVENETLGTAMSPEEREKGFNEIKQSIETLQTGTPSKDMVIQSELGTDSLSPDGNTLKQETGNPPESFSISYTEPSRSNKDLDITSNLQEKVSILQTISQESAEPFKKQLEYATGLPITDIRIKSSDSIISKIKRNEREGKTASGINDALGGRIVVQPSDVYNALYNVRKNFKVISIKDFFKKPSEDWGYQGININVVLPNGVKAEIQIHTPESKRVFTDVHKFYAKWRDYDVLKLSEEQKNEYKADLAKTKEMSKNIVIIPTATTSEAKADINKSTGVRKETEEISISEKKAFLATLKAQVKAASIAEKATRADIFDIQSGLVDMINKSDLEANDKAKFLTTIKNINSQKDLNKNLPIIEERISELEQKQEKRDLISNIKKSVKNANESSSISIDYVNAIDDLLSGVDLQGRKPETLDRINRMKEAIDSKIASGEDVRVTKGMMSDLNILDKKRLADVSNEELKSLLDNINKFIQLGETKLKARENLILVRKQKALEALAKDSVPLEAKEVKTAKVGQKLAAADKLKNKFNESLNVIQEKNIAIAPMDVVFDILDGNKKYKGANHRIFKKQIDAAYSKYLVRKSDIESSVKELAIKLKLKHENLEKIGFYAAKNQEGGVDKLMAIGYTEKEIEELTLTDDEMKLYNSMRDKLDSLRPSIEEVLRVNYNQNMGTVKNYFPFMTDFDAMRDSEIRDRFGDNVEQFGMAKRKNVEKGFTKSRIGGKNKIKLNALEVFLRHVDNAAYLIETGPVIKELGEIASTPQYGEAVGEYGQEIVRDWIDLLARKGRAAGDRINIFDTIRKNVGVATLGFKLSSVLVQPTALFDGGSLIGLKAFEGAFNVATNKEWRVFLKNNFPELKSRLGDDQSFVEFNDSSKVMDKIGNAGFWALKNIDMLTASAVTAGAYQKIVEEKGGKVDFNSPDKDAINEAQLLLRRTQSSSLFKDSPSALSQGKLTGNISTDKLILQFQSFMLNRWSLIQHDMYRSGIKEKDFGKAFNIAFFLILANLAEVGLRRVSKEMIAQLTGDDLKDWEDTYTNEIIDSIRGNVPVLSQYISATNFGSIPIPAIDMFNRMAKRLSAANKSKRDDTKARNYIRAISLGVGTAFAIPGTVQGEQFLKDILSD